jgi:hypothetical protein
MMTGGLNLEPGAAPDESAGTDEQLGQDGDGVGLGVGGDGLDDGCRHPRPHGRIGWFGPANRGGHQAVIVAISATRFGGELSHR